MEKYGMLTFLEDAGKNKHAQKLWRMRCDCGNETIANASSIRTGKTKSCGCFKKRRRSNLRHGKRHTRLYTIWCNMKARCDRQDHPAYANYGGRGIVYTPEWSNFIAFARDVGDPPSPEHTLDRINNDGNYEPSNVRWAVRGVQARNTRQNIWVEIDGVTKCLYDWLDIYNIHASTVYRRMAKGEDVISAICRKSTRAKLRSP